MISYDLAQGVAVAHTGMQQPLLLQRLQTNLVTTTWRGVAHILDRHLHGAVKRWCETKL